ncbi:SHOCT domain-containing protein [Microbacter margulisiae]|uniref:Putative membrane protein n=1 Tax=Microbacter margulisiae TaxID=1350067 RepID=A0A7W5DP03_9PORP|nr:SHOCT domain-containing protein [Microbacter margulisiae]MBB3186083.1 putative membrane protein [Microbacter margulisiae]
MYGLHGMGMGFGFGWIIGIAVLVLIVWAIMKVVNNCHQPRKDDDRSGLDILKQRYANGEISKEEYEEMKRVIS